MKTPVHFCVAIALACSTVVGGLVACGGDVATSPKISGDPATIFRSVRLNHRVVNLTSAPYDTITLSLKAFNGLGAELSLDQATIRFISADTVALKVSPAGLIISRKPNVPTWIIASVTMGTTTHRDSVYAIQLDGDPTITGLSVPIVAPDTAIVGPQQYRWMPVSLNGTNLDGLLVYAQIPDTNVLYIAGDIGKTVGTPAQVYGNETGISLIGILPGHTTIRLSTTLRGVTYTDSVVYTVRRGWGSAYLYTVLERYRDGTSRYRVFPETMYVKVGGVVGWNVQGNSVNFEDPSKAYPGATSGSSAVSGNIAPFIWSYFDYARSRTFIAPGTIRWTSPEINVSGVVIVFDESLCLPNCPPSATP